MRAGLFVTCLVDLMRPSIGFAALKLLEAAGCEVVVPPTQTCCGQPGYNSGDRASARAPADELTRVKRLCERTYELTDFLVNVVKFESISATFNGTVTYHDSCSGLREMGVKSQPRALLAKVAGLTLQEMNEAETCCGFGGTFAVKFGEISTRLADNNCGHALATGADAVVLGDLGCMLNIEGRLRRRGDRKTKVLHVAEVLAGEAVAE